MIEVAGDAALTVDPDDADAIADAIVLLADDNAARRLLAERGPTRARFFTSEKMALATLAVYRLAAGRPTSSFPPPSDS